MIVKWFMIGDIVMENEKRSFLGKKVAILTLSLIGFITTIKLAMIYYNANFNPYALPSFCSISEFIDCDGIAKTTESQFFGIPLAYWGMFLYFVIAVLLFADKLKNIKLFKFMEVFKNPLDYIASLGIISFTISMLLLVLSLFEIKKLCILCAFTYVLNLLIALIAIDYNNGGVIKAFKNSFKDFFDAVKIKKYTIAFTAAVAATCVFLTYTTVSNIFTPQVKKQKDFKEFVSAKVNKYSAKGNILGDENAELVVYTYTDYLCPICGIYNIMIHKLAKELKNVRFEHVNLPLDMECNKYLQRPFHVGSCRLAKYAIAAEKQNKFLEINSIFFEKRPQTEEAVIEIAKSLGLNIEQLKKDAESPETAKRIENDIEKAAALGLSGTPSTVVGDKTYVGIKPYDDLKEILIKAGAKKRGF